MEDGKLPLEESLAAYQRGAELLKLCEAKLADAQARIQVLDGETLQRLHARRSERSRISRPGRATWPAGWRRRSRNSCRPRASRPARLHDAMRYSTLGGGKRVRAMLVFAAGRSPGADRGAPRDRRRGGRADPRLFADPRRPAVHGRRRPAPRQAHLPRRVRRGHGAPRRATRCKASPSSCWPRTASPTIADTQLQDGAALRGGVRLARHGGRAGDRPRRGRQGASRCPSSSSCTSSRPAR